jgi:hypothetical protein
VLSIASGSCGAVRAVAMLMLPWHSNMCRGCSGNGHFQRLCSPTLAGYRDVLTTGFGRAPVAGLNLVSSITLHSKNASSITIDAVTIGYNSSGSKVTQVLGNRDAAHKGITRASISLGAEDRVRALYIWTDSSQLVVKGVMLVLWTGAVLDASFDLETGNATVRKNKDGELGSGLLLGIAAAAKPDTEFLSAVSFAFLKAPVSAAIAVDMANIDIESARITPKQKLDSWVQGNIDIEASCPRHTETVTYKDAYTKLPAIAAVKARVEALVGAPLFTGTVTRLKRSTELVATERQDVPGLGALSDTWRDAVRGADGRAQPAWSTIICAASELAANAASPLVQVSDVFDDAGQLTPEAGRSTILEGPELKFVVKKGETVRCSYLYWERELTTSYTVTATLFFDSEGAAAWETSIEGERQLR